MGGRVGAVAVTRMIEEGWFVNGKWIPNPEYEWYCTVEKHRYDGVPTALVPIGGSP